MSGLRIGPQLMDGLSAGRSPPRRKRKGRICLCVGPAKKSRVPDEETNQLTAYHEAGHTLVAMFTKDATALNKVTIIPRGGSLGHVSYADHLRFLFKSLLHT